MDVWTVLVGVATIVLIVVLRQTTLGAMGFFVAIMLGSALAAIVRAFDRDVQLVDNVTDVPNWLPDPAARLRRALSVDHPGILAGVRRAVQGAGVSAGFAGSDSGSDSTDRDFVGQGVGNLGAGIFRGMPVGGAVEYIAMPALSGLLIVVGIEAIKLDDISSVYTKGWLVGSVSSYAARTLGRSCLTTTGPARRSRCDLLIHEYRNAA